MLLCNQGDNENDGPLSNFSSNYVCVLSQVYRPNIAKKKYNKALVAMPVEGTGKGSKMDEYSERFQTAVDPLPPSLRMVPISGNHEHAFHTMWPSVSTVVWNFSENYLTW